MALLIITAFAVAFFNFPHVVGSALLFIIALTNFAAPLVVPAKEVTIPVRGYDNC